MQFASSKNFSVKKYVEITRFCASNPTGRATQNLVSVFVWNKCKFFIDCFQSLHKKCGPQYLVFEIFVFSFPLLE